MKLTTLKVDPRSNDEIAITATTDAITDVTGVE